MNLKEQQYTLSGLTINVVEGGTGTPMFFLHNGGGFWQSWQHQLDHFSKNFNVFAIDWPGCGKSEYPGRPLDQQTNLALLEAFIAEKQFEKIIFVGNCIGASAALEYSIKFPQKVQALILMNICPGDRLLPSWISKKSIAKINHTSLGFKIRYNTLRIIVPGIATRFVFPKILFTPGISSTDPIFRQYRKKQREKNQQRSRFDLFFAAHSFNLDTIIKGREIPSHLLLWGHENRVAPFKKFAEFSQQLLQNPSIEVIENGGHLMAYEQHERVNSCIDNYLNRHQ